MTMEQNALAIQTTNSIVTLCTFSEKQDTLLLTIIMTGDDKQLTSWICFEDLDGLIEMFTKFKEFKK